MTLRNLEVTTKVKVPHDSLDFGNGRHYEAIYVTADAMLEGLSVHGWFDDGVHVAGEGVEPVIENCSAFENEGVGISFSNGAVGSVSDCDIYGNAQSGIKISCESTAPYIRACKIHQFVNGEGNNAGLNNSGWRSFKKQLLGVGVLEQSSSAVGVHFYSNVPLPPDFRDYILASASRARQGRGFSDAKRAAERGIWKRESADTPPFCVRVVDPKRQGAWSQEKDGRHGKTTSGKAVWRLEGQFRVGCQRNGQTKGIL